jgi:hypothetical protein
MPWRRLLRISSRCSGRGRPLISTTLSSMRVKMPDDLPEAVPVEARSLGERIDDEAREIDGAEQAGAVGGQGLLTAGIGGADVLAEPVVVHLVDAVDEDEARLGVVVGGRHDLVPQVAGRGSRCGARGRPRAPRVDDVAVLRSAKSASGSGVRGPTGLRPSASRVFAVTGKARGHVASALTACTNSSVISRDRLNWRRRPSSRLAPMNSKTSGWPTSKVAIWAPRRPPAEEMVKHMRS